MEASGRAANQREEGGAYPRDLRRRQNKVKREEKRDVPSVSRTPVWRPGGAKKEKELLVAFITC